MAMDTLPFELNDFFHCKQSMCCLFFDSRDDTSHSRSCNRSALLTALSERCAGVVRSVVDSDPTKCSKKKCYNHPLGIHVPS